MPAATELALLLRCRDVDSATSLAGAPSSSSAAAVAVVAGSAAAAEPRGVKRARLDFSTSWDAGDGSGAHAGTEQVEGEENIADGADDAAAAAAPPVEVARALAELVETKRRLREVEQEAAFYRRCKDELWEAVRRIGRAWCSVSA
jgi:hypothetical protein